MTRPPRRSVLVAASTLVLATLVATGLVPGPAAADDPTATAGTIEDLQGDLAGCTGTVAAPQVIALTADISSTSTSLTVPCVVRLELTGHALSVAAVTVSPGESLLVGDLDDPDTAGSLTVNGFGSPTGITITSATLEVDGATVTTTTVTADHDGRLDVAGGTLQAGTAGRFGGTGVSLGDDGLMALSGGAVTALGGPGGDGGVTVGDDGSVLVAGGTLTADGTGGGLASGVGVGVGARGLVIDVAGELRATGGSNQAGISLPATARMTVSGGIVRATGGSSGAGIGSGSGAAAGQLEVGGGQVVAVGGANADGVGAGNGGTSGPLAMTGGTLTASAPSTGSALGVDATSGPLAIEAGTLRLPSGPMLIPDVLGGPELVIGPKAVLDGSSPNGGSSTYATFSGPGQLRNLGLVKVPRTTVTAGGVQLIGDYFHVTFDTQGGTPSSVAPAYVLAPSYSLYGLRFPADPAKAGYIFRGWNTAVNGKGTTITRTSQLPGQAGGGAPAEVRLHAIFAFVAPQLALRVSSPVPRSVHGWYRKPVTVHFTCTRGTLPLESTCPSAVVLRTEGRGQRVSGSVSDTDGHVTTRSVGRIGIDLTPPVVQVTGVTRNATYQKLQKVGCRNKDALSGPDHCTVVTHRKKYTIFFHLVGYDHAGNLTALDGAYHLVKPAS